MEDVYTKQDILDKISDIATIKEEIREAIIRKEVDVPSSAKISTYSGYIDQIRSTKGEERYFTINDNLNHLITTSSPIYDGMTSVHITTSLPSNAYLVHFSYNDDSAEYIGHVKCNLTVDGVSQTRYSPHILKSSYSQANMTSLTFQEKYDGCAEWSIEYVDTSNLESIICRNCYNLTDASSLYLGSGIQFNFENCRKLKYLPTLNTSSLTQFGAFYGCESIESIPLIDLGNLRNWNDPFRYCYSLTSVGGFRNLGKSLTYTAAGIDYGISFADSPLTRQSVLNIFNNLYDMTGSTISQGMRRIYLKGTTYDSLLDEDINIATRKNWIVIRAN